MQRLSLDLFVVLHFVAGPFSALLPPGEIFSLPFLAVISSAPQLPAALSSVIQLPVGLSFEPQRFPELASARCRSASILVSKKVLAITIVTANESPEITAPRNAVFPPF